MAKRWIGVGVSVIAALAVAAARPDPAAAELATSCETQDANADCGGTAGDAFCLDQTTGMPDPLQDCVDTGAGCGCRPRICCDCDDASNNQISACNLPCTQTGIGLLLCVGLCALVDDNPQETCNLQIVNRATCQGDGCATTGCCTFSESNARTVSQSVCLETNADTCSLIGEFGTAMFVPDGTCLGGLSGTCAAPTPTSTATVTLTATSTRTVTNTPTVTQTPTRTLVPDGGDCATPAECSSTFCVDGVCCDTICDQPFESCNQPGMRGTCADLVAPAPALSNLSLLIALVSLAVVGALALMWRRAERP
jgi:hypothetical protein